MIPNHSLSHYNPNYPFRLTEDGSDRGFGSSDIAKWWREAIRILSKTENWYYRLHKKVAGIPNEKSSPLFVWAQMTASSCLQYLDRNVRFRLANYTYNVEWVSANRIANWLSRARLPEQSNTKKDIGRLLHYIFKDNEKLPPNFEDIYSATKKDRLLRKVIWSLAGLTELESMFTVCSSEGWSYLQHCISQWLGSCTHHMVICKVKRSARSYVWWHKLDIDEKFKDCGAFSPLKLF